jgi:GntR family phosphonate transport system transcriptional regulator
MESLARNGVVRVEQGRGAFVAEDVLGYEVSARTRFSEWIRRHNKEPSGRTLQVREVAATRKVAAGLSMEPGGAVVQFDRLGMADGVPIGLASHYFPSAGLPGLLEALRAHPTITEALQAVGVDDYLRLRTRVSARLPTAAEAKQLELARVRPLLVCENVNVDRDGRVVEFGIARYPSTRVQVVFEP